jgi:AcrR family transcriptional regulator
MTEQPSAPEPMVRPDTRGALLRAAAWLLDSEGPGAVTLRAVGQRIGVTQTTVYRHFADKDALLGEVAVAFVAELREAIELAIGRASDPWARLRALMRSFQEQALAAPHRYGLIVRPNLGNASHTRLDHAIDRLYEEVLVPSVVACQAAGLLPDVEPHGLSLVLFTCLHGSLDLTMAEYLSPYKGVAIQPPPGGVVQMLMDLLHQPPQT